MNPFVCSRHFHLLFLQCLGSANLCVPSSFYFASFCLYSDCGCILLKAMLCPSVQGGEPVLPFTSPVLIQLCLHSFERNSFFVPPPLRRVENLYFTYLFVLRAAMKAGPILEAATYDTGSPAEDARTKELVLRRACRLESGTY